MRRVRRDHAVVRREQHAAGVVPRLHRFLDAGKGRVEPLALGHVERDVREYLERRVEQDGTLDAVGVARRELGDEPAAEAVPDPESRLVGHRLEDRREVRLDVPGRVPRRVAVARAGRERRRAARSRRASRTGRRTR